MTKLEQAGAATLAEMVTLWKLDVIDPAKTDQSAKAIASRSVIDHILKEAGWGFASPYVGNHQLEWCGFTAAAAWRAAGINPAWLATFFASTYRLQCFATYQKFNQRTPNPAPGPGVQDRRMLLKLTPSNAQLIEAGDIVIVGDGEPSYGDHITIADRWDAATGSVVTYSGNGVGVGPDGKRREGIVKASFSFAAKYRPMWAIRPAESDLL